MRTQVTTSPVLPPVSLSVNRWLFIHGVRPDMEKERCKKRPHSAQFTQKSCSPVCLVFVLSLPAWKGDSNDLPGDRNIFLLPTPSQRAIPRYSVSVICIKYRIQSWLHEIPFYSFQISSKRTNKWENEREGAAQSKPQAEGAALC